MASIGDVTRPAFAYDSATDTWVPVGIGPHTHTASTVGAVATSSFAAKGDLLVGTGAGTLATQTVGANGTVLTADSAEADGVKWATPAAGGGMTLLSTTAITAVDTLSITGIDQTYNQLVIVMANAAMVAVNNNAALQFNSVTSSGNYTWGAYELIHGSQSGNANTSEIRWLQGATTTTNVNNIVSVITIPRYTDTTPNKLIAINTTYIGGDASARKALTVVGSFRATSAISSIQFLSAGGQNFTAQGNIYIYGVK
jgi:hypothetical protein